MSGGAIEREAKKLFWQNRKSQNREDAKSESERLGKLRRQKSESKSPKSFHTTSNRRELGKKRLTLWCREATVIFFSFGRPRLPKAATTYVCTPQSVYG